MIVVPLLLCIGTQAKTKRLTQAVADGSDYLFYTMFEVPYRVVRQNTRWESLSLLTPQLDHAGTEERRGPVDQPILDENYTFASYVALLFSGVVVYKVVVWIPFMLASSIIFPSFMILLTELALDPTWSVRHRAALIKVLMVFPAAALLLGAAMNVYSTRAILYADIKGFGGSLKTSLGAAHKLCLHLMNPMGFPVLTLSLILPSWKALRGVPLNSGEVFIFTQLWSAGGFLFFFKTVAFLMEGLFGAGPLWSVLRISMCTKLKGMYLQRAPWNRCLYGFMLDPRTLEAFGTSHSELVQVYGLTAWTEFAAEWLQQKEQCEGKAWINEKQAEKVWIDDLQAKLDAM